VHGARSCVTHLDRTRHRLGERPDRLQARMHVNKVTVALAAKIARMAWVILTKPGGTLRTKGSGRLIAPTGQKARLEEVMTKQSVGAS